MADKMIGNEAAEQAEGAAPPVTGVGDISTGMNGQDPAVQSKINDIMKLRAGDYGKSAVMGAAAGAQAGQGAGSPLNAFIQGMAAGLQAPAQIYQAKREQVQSVLDATPFGVTHPEIAKQPGYSILAGLPTKLALQAVSQIAQDSAKVARQGEQDRETKKLDFMLKQTELGLRGKDPMSIKDQIDLRKSFEGIEAVKQYQVAAPAYEMIINSEAGIGDKVAVIKFAQMLNPTVRVNESTMDSMDASGTFDKFTSDAWRKAKEGTELGPEERRKLISEATKIYNQRSRDFHEVASVVREQAIEEGFNPAHIVNESPVEIVERLDKNGNRVMLQKMADGTFRKVN